MKDCKIGPSIISFDFGNISKEIANLEKAGADFLHIDVMDGHFVPNLTVGPKFISDIRKYTNLFFDIHLMIENAENYLIDYVKSGASQIVLHVESVMHLNRAISFIKSRNIKVGVSLNPSTSEECLRYVIDYVDSVLIMTVNPGFSGQNFIYNCLNKIGKIKDMINNSNNKNCNIMVDGGINEKTIKSCYEQGAKWFVSGDYILKGPSYEEAISSLKKLF